MSRNAAHSVISLIWVVTCESICSRYLHFELTSCKCSILKVKISLDFEVQDVLSMSRNAAHSVISLIWVVTCESICSRYLHFELTSCKCSILKVKISLDFEVQDVLSMSRNAAHSVISLIWVVTCESICSRYLHFELTSCKCSILKVKISLDFEVQDVLSMSRNAAHSVISLIWVVTCESICSRYLHFELTSCKCSILKVKISLDFEVQDVLSMSRNAAHSVISLIWVVTCESICSRYLHFELTSCLDLQ
eukprot:403375405